ncbi:MAG: hypothetical protein LBE67_14065 [Kocuria palustris]|nr:hypothetical protein [Kocuria palustris]
MSVGCGTRADDVDGGPAEAGALDHVRDLRAAIDGGADLGIAAREGILVACGCRAGCLGQLGHVAGLRLRLRCADDAEHHLRVELRRAVEVNRARAVAAGGPDRGVTALDRLAALLVQVSDSLRQLVQGLGAAHSGWSSR